MSVTPALDRHPPTGRATDRLPLAPLRRVHRCVADVAMLGDLIERLWDAQDQEWSADRAQRIEQAHHTMNRLAECDLARGWCRVSGPVDTARHCPTCACGGGGMSAPSLDTLRTLLDAQFGGFLRAGTHVHDEGAVCALELLAVARGEAWTDSPDALGVPDLRTLNDAPWSSDAARTEHLLPVLAAYDGWSTWTAERRRQVVQRIALGTVQRVLPLALRSVGLAAQAEACARASTLADAAGAAGAAGAAAGAAGAAWAAADTARAARAAADAAYAAAADTARAARAAYAAAADAASDAASAADVASYAASAASYVASYAAYAAGAAARAAGAVADDILAEACQVWIEAAA